MRRTQHADPHVDLFSPEAVECPWPAYKALRDHAPVYFVPEMNLYMVTRYDLVKRIVKDPETYSSECFEFQLEVARGTFLKQQPPDVQREYREIMAQTIDLPSTLATSDAPGHTFYRKLALELFNPRRVKAAEPQVREVIDDVLASIAPSTSADFIAEFGAPVPQRVLASRFGIPNSDFAFFRDAAVARSSEYVNSGASAEEVIRRATLYRDFQRYIVEIAEQRRGKPGEDLISILVNETLGQRHLDHGEMLSIIDQFVIAGQETTTSSFGFGMLALCRSAELQETLRKQPDKIEKFSEEIVRSDSPAQGLPRKVMRDVELEGVALKKGDLLMVQWGSANRDERIFSHPDSIDVERPNGNAHLGFGFGIHYCVGAPLARQELNLGFAAILESWGDIRLNTDRPAPHVAPSYVIRGLSEVPVRYHWLLPSGDATRARDGRSDS